MSILSEAYTLEQFKALFSILDDATVENLYNVFIDREPISGFSNSIKRTEILYSRQYNDLIRDESVQYDAMVTDYIEGLTNSKLQKGGSDKETIEYNSGETTEYNSGLANVKTGATARTIEGSKSKVQNGSRTLTKDGSIIEAKSGVEKTTESGADSIVKSGVETLGISGSHTLEREGTETHSRDISTSNTRSGGETKTTNGGYSDSKKNSAVRKSNPMSIEYAAEVDTTASSDGGGSLAYPNMSSTWNTADEQNAGREVNNREYNNLAENTIYNDVADAGTDKGDFDKLEYTNRKDVDTYTDYQEQTKYGADGDARSDTTNYGKVVTVDYDGETNGDLTIHTGPKKETKYDGYKENEVFNNIEEKETYDGYKENEAYESITDTSSKTGNDSKTHNGSDARTTEYGATESTKETNRYSGRRGFSPAELLAKSREYILGTDAFKWLYFKFDRCFEWEVNI